MIFSGTVYPQPAGHSCTAALYSTFIEANDNIIYLTGMKHLYKYLGLACAVAVFITIIGMWARITHKSYAENLFAVGMWFMAICAAVFVYTQISKLSNKN
jgi:hypothetical protein